MASDSEVHYTADSVCRGIEALVYRENEFKQSVQVMKTQLQELAMTLVAVGSDHQVSDTRAMFSDLVNMDNEMSLHVQALQDVKRTYMPSATVSDFKNIIKRKHAQLMASRVFDPEQSSEMKDFDKEAGLQGRDDDDVEEVGDTSGLRNEKCPLTLKSVYELTEPVADHMEFIYEKTAILDHIKQGRGLAKCPVQGTNHMITRDQIKPALQVERAKRRKNLRAAFQSKPAGNEEQVYDVDE